MGLSAPSTGKAAGASPLKLASLVIAVGSAPPPPAKPPEPPPSNSLRSSLPLAQRPLHRQSRRSLPLKLASLVIAVGSAPPPPAKPPEPPHPSILPSLYHPRFRSFMRFVTDIERPPVVDHCQTMAIFLKLLLTPVLIAIATLAARRYGLALGGWLAGLPLVSAPVSIFLALEEGPEFAGSAARAGLLGLVAVAGFCLAYVLVARKGVGFRGDRRDRRISPVRIIPGAPLRRPGRLLPSCHCGHFRGPDRSGPPLLRRRCPGPCRGGIFLCAWRAPL